MAKRKHAAYQSIKNLLAWRASKRQCTSPGSGSAASEGLADDSAGTSNENVSSLDIEEASGDSTHTNIMHRLLQAALQPMRLQSIGHVPLLR